MRRSVAARALSAVLVILFVGAQPSVLCAVDCLLQRHGVRHEMHAGHHGAAPEQPCHTGQVAAGTTVATAVLAVTSLPPQLDVGVVMASESQTALPRHVPSLRSTVPQIDTPPPRG